MPSLPNLDLQKSGDGVSKEGKILLNEMAPRTLTLRLLDSSAS